MHKLYEYIHEDVAREARLASNKWNGIMDADDVEQELWVYILESPSVQKYLLEAEPAQLSKALSIKASHLCSQERLDIDHATGNWNYNPAEVRELLNAYWGSDVHNVSQAVMSLAQENLSPTMIQNITGGTIAPDERIDLEQALEQLEETHPQHFFVLQEAYYAGIEPSHHVMKVRAVEQLTTTMNRTRSQREMDRHEGPGTKPKIVMEEY